MLRVVGDADVQAELARARTRELAAEEELQEGRLARAVGTDERHAVAAVEREVDALVDGLVLKRLGDVREAGHHVAGARGVGELEVDVLVPFGQDHELALDLLDPADPLLGLGGLGGLVAELVDEDLHVGDLALLGRALGPHLLEVVGALLQVARVVAGVDRQTPVLEGGHMVDARIHEGPVVGDDEHRAVVAGDEAAEPLDALEVEVVRGLVEQEEVGMAQEELGQRDAHLPAA